MNLCEGWPCSFCSIPFSDLNLPTILKAGGSLTFGPNEKSVTITIGADVTVYRGATLVIRCPVESADDTRVFWTNINGRPVTVGKAAQVGNDIVISDIDERYAIPFICTARTRRGQDNARSTVLVKGILNFEICLPQSHLLCLLFPLRLTTIQKVNI